MGEIISTLIAVVLQGGPQIVAVLLLIIILLLIERARLIKIVEHKAKHGDDLTETFHLYSSRITNVLSEFKMLLFEIKGRLGG